MASFLARRLLWAVSVLVIVWMLTFLLAYVIPADPARAMAGVRASQEDVDRIRNAIGLDRPLLDQIALYIGRVTAGDLGVSFSNRRPVLELILDRLPATMVLAFAGLAIQLAIGLPLGIAAALRRGRVPDKAALVYSSVAAAIPAFWLGYALLLVLAFLPAVAFGVGIFPIGGYESGSLRYLILPALTLGIVGSPAYVRLMRASLLDEFSQGYWMTARSKGLTERRVLWRHGVPNALNPVVTQLGLDMGLLLGGVVVVERVFSWPGIGSLAVDAVLRGDLPVIIGTVLVGTVFVLVANLLADVVNVLLDPRLRHAI